MHPSTSISTAVTRRVALALAFIAILLAGSLVPAAAAIGRSTFRPLASTGARTQAYTPDQIAAAYNFNPLYSRGLNGTGQKIALIETGTVNISDLNQFNAAAGLPAAHLTHHYVGGKTFAVSYDPEATLDVEWVHALAPQATILLYYLNDKLSMKAGWAAMGSALRSAASHGAGAISISLGVCNAGSGYQTTRSALAAVAAQGVSVFVASGDSGDHPGPVRQCGNSPGVSLPAADPSVVAVGGTSVQLNGDNSLASEVAWILSGGGPALNLIRASWQTAPTLPADTKRWIPDVSFLGDPATGVRVFYHGRWQQVGGTSLGAPAWAAAWSLIRQDGQQSGKTVGAAEQLVYRIGNSSSYGRAFHDIVSGSNGLYSAGPGWDPVTGWGTPDVTNLDGAVKALSS